LSEGRRGKRAEVAISDKVIGTNCTVQRGGEEDVALFRKGNGRDGCNVVCEGDEAESGIGGPHCDLAVVATVWPSGAYVEIVSLLLENVRFRLPFLNE